MAELQMIRNPFDVLAQTQQMLSRIDPMFGRGALDDTEQDAGTLALDIYAADDALYVEASVPGFRKEDITVQLHQGLLSIVAQHPATKGAEGYEDRRYYRRERPWGAWMRRVALPGIVHDAEVQAELRDGVLKLRVPIPEAAKPKHIEIRSGSADATDSVFVGTGEAGTSGSNGGTEA